MEETLRVNPVDRLLSVHWNLINNLQRSYTLPQLHMQQRMYFPQIAQITSTISWTAYNAPVIVSLATDSAFLRCSSSLLVRLLDQIILSVGWWIYSISTNVGQRVY